MITLAQIQALDPALVQSRDDVAIAAALSVGRTKVVSRLGGVGLVMATLGADAGAALLDQLEAAGATIPALRWAFVLINRGELDFGDAATRASLDLYTPPEVAAALKATAEVPDPVSVYDVQIALYNDDGSYK